MCLAEQEHFNHIHFHIVPRAEDQPEALKGVKIFAHLKVTEQESIPPLDIANFCELLRGSYKVIE